jgi:hypothetical protein
LLVLIDENGDTGFKEGSSRYFVMTLVVFTDSDNNGRYPSAEHAATVIKSIQEETGHKPEFHFSQCSHKVRHSFFNGLNKNRCEFGIYALVIDKSKIYSPHLRSNTKNFYNFILKQLLARNPIQNANVKIDGEKSKDFKRELKTYLRRDQDGMIRKLTFSNSRNDSLIQLADMCCSAIAYKYNRADRLESDLYVKLLRGRIKNIWEFE